MPTAKVTKNVSAAIGGGNVLCSTLISIKTKAWLFWSANNIHENLLHLVDIIGENITEFCTFAVG